MGSERENLSARGEQQPPTIMAKTELDEPSQERNGYQRHRPAKLPHDEVVDPARQKLCEIKTDGRLTFWSLPLPDQQSQRKISKADSEDPEW